MNLRRTVLGFLGALALGSSLVTPAFAATTVTQQITSGGALAASVADATMQSVTYSNTVATTTGTLVLSVSDPRGTSVGWNVTIQSTDFVRTGALLANVSAHDIPASGFLITSVGTPAMTAGQAVDPVGGPRALSSAVASLDQARKTISADAGFGSGNYTQSIPVSLVIPALSQTGTYTATLTVQISSAP
jgi:WxL domain surface cell wall-binding